MRAAREAGRLDQTRPVLSQQIVAHQRNRRTADGQEAVVRRASDQIHVKIGATALFVRHGIDKPLGARKERLFGQRPGGREACGCGSPEPRPFGVVEVAVVEIIEVEIER